jgi:hypothetical protein
LAADGKRSKGYWKKKKKKNIWNQFSPSSDKWYCLWNKSALRL